MSKVQTPAKGILKKHDWGNSKVYQIVCECGQPDHTHTLWVEADECDISVQIFVDVKSKWWSMNRFKQIWTLLTKGYLQHETVVSMDEQTAINYAETLKSAIKDVKLFKAERKEKSITAKMAEQGDCI